MPDEYLMSGPLAYVTRARSTTWSTHSHRLAFCRSWSPCIAIVLDAAVAEEGYRKTLMQWSYGTSFEGGPDVYEPLVTDRPDFTEASVTVGYGVVQLETGYTFTYDSDGDERPRSHSFPETLLRVGMFAEWFEFRVDWNYARRADRDRRRRGFDFRRRRPGPGHEDRADAAGMYPARKRRSSCR